MQVSGIVARADTLSAVFLLLAVHSYRMSLSFKAKLHSKTETCTLHHDCVLHHNPHVQCMYLALIKHYSYTTTII